MGETTPGLGVLTADIFLLRSGGKEKLKLLLVNLYPEGTMCQYLLSSYTLKAYLDKHKDHIEVEVVNYSLKESIEYLWYGITQGITIWNPDHIGFSCYIWNISKIDELYKRLSDKYSLILGGPEILKDSRYGCYTVYGEGEEGLLWLIRNLDQELIVPEPKYIEDLDDIPSPYLSGAIPEYLYKRQMALVETQRGCRYRCAYCVYHKNLPKVKYYSLERIKQELTHIIKDIGVYALRFCDASLTSDLPRAKEIVKHLINLKQECKLPWIYWEWRWEEVDEEFVQLLSQLKYKENICNSNELEPLDKPQHYTEMLEGYTAVNSVGIESFNPESMKAVGRAPVDLEKFSKFMELVRGYNITAKFDFIMNLPYETTESFTRSMEYFIPLLQNTDHILNIHLLSVLPSSKLENYKGLAYNNSKAPYLVTSTDWFSKEELEIWSRDTAVLLRVLNSPLRKCIYEGKFKVTQEEIMRDFPNINLFKNGLVTEEYWENKIYEDIPSEWLIKKLKA